MLIRNAKFWKIYIFCDFSQKNPLGCYSDGKSSSQPCYQMIGQYQQEAQKAFIMHLCLLTTQYKLELTVIFNAHSTLKTQKSNRKVVMITFIQQKMEIGLLFEWKGCLLIKEIYLHAKMNKSYISLGGRYHSFPIRQKLFQSVADGLLEDLPHVFRSHIKVLPNLTLLDPISNHLLVTLTYISKVHLVVICHAILTNLPKSNGSNGVIANIELSTRIDAFTHLDHSLFLRSFDLSLSADTHDDVSCMCDRNEINLILEEIIQFPDDILPSIETDACKLANIELLEVIFLFETGGIDRIA